jgi:hypothetical protein
MRPPSGFFHRDEVVDVGDSNCVLAKVKDD